MARISVTISDEAGTACRLSMKPEATVGDLSERFGRFFARKHGLDGRQPFRLVKDGADLEATAAVATVKDDFLVAVAPPGAPPPPPPPACLLYTSPSPRDQRGSRMPSSA